MGMICSEDELSLGSHEGIMIYQMIRDSWNFTAILIILMIENDIVLEIGLTPNRSDAMGHIGHLR